MVTFSHSDSDIHQLNFGEIDTCALPNSVSSLEEPISQGYQYFGAAIRMKFKNSKRYRRGWGSMQPGFSFAKQSDIFHTDKNLNQTWPMVNLHNDVIKWKHFPRYWPFVRGIHFVTGDLHSQRPVTRSFDVFFDLCLNKGLKEQSLGRWFETPSRSLWRHCN